MRKVFDMAVKTGEYTAPNGQSKGRWENIGSVMENNEGKLFALIKRTFSPAGISVDEGKDSIIVSLFEPKQDNRQGGGQTYRAQDGGNWTQQSNGNWTKDEPPQKTRNNHLGEMWGQPDASMSDADGDVPF